MSLRAAILAPDGLRQAYRAIRLLPRALEALYPLTRSLPVISRFFLEPGRREDTALLTRLREANPLLKTPASSISTTTGRAAAAFPSMCRNTTAAKRPGR